MTLVRGLLLAAAGGCLALAPVYAITVSKLDVQNTFVTRSDRQLVSFYGLPPVALGSNASASTTKTYGTPPSTSGPYPYATSTNSQAKFILPKVNNVQQYINNGEYASSILSTVDPAAALSISSWSWYLGTSRIGTVPDPSVYRRKGPGGLNVYKQPWISVDITLANTAKPRQFESSNPDNPEDPNSFPVFVQEEEKPLAVLSFPDFGVIAVPNGLTREQEILQHEQPLMGMAGASIPPNSQGALPPPRALVGRCVHPKRGFKKPGWWVDLVRPRSCATYEASTDFVPALVPPPKDFGFIPDRYGPVEVVLLGSTADRDGRQPTIVFSRGNGKLREVRLGPGATVTFQVRILVGAIHVVDPSFKLLVLMRMRETSISPTGTTRALFIGAVDYPELVVPTALGGSSTRSAPAARAPGGPDPLVGPQDRQHWAHLVRLYNRSLRCAAPAVSGKRR